MRYRTLVVFYNIRGGIIRYKLLVLMWVHPLFTVMKDTIGRSADGSDYIHDITLSVYATTKCAKVLHHLPAIRLRPLQTRPP